ncbi:MAG TPA: hypothetical protein VK477_11055 [Acidobacteriota bacterium]|nr:hypothetical protein [Acidobacteriota bacterium]
MAFLRALPWLLGVGAVFLASCSTPPPPRVTTRTVYRINTALLLASEDGSLSAEQLQARRDEVVRYLTERGLLAPEDVLVSNAAAADRIIRVAVAGSGEFKVTIFNPGSTGAYYSADPADIRVRAGAEDYWPIYDPWFDQGYYYSPSPAPGYYRYQPRDYLRPHYPRDYLAPVEPRRTPPPPVLRDPTPQPHPRDRNHDGRPDHGDRNHDGRPDWRDRAPPKTPDVNRDHGGRDHDIQPRPTPPPPRIEPPTRSDPPRSTPPEPRPAPPRARDEDRRDDPQPAR